MTSVTHTSQTVIFDLDGTLALIDARRDLATKNRTMDWDVFSDPINISLDKPNWPVINTLKALSSTFNIGILSGRDDITYDATCDWLFEHGVNPNHLDFFLMRPHGDYTPDDILKKQWLDQLIDEGHNIICVYDDRDKVVKMWRENNIPCFQVNYGDF
jgi:hypothetical protein